MAIILGISQRPKCAPQLSGSSTQLSIELSDIFQAQINGWGFCIGIVHGEHRRKGRSIKWVKAEGVPGSLQGGEEELERGKR